MPEVEVHLHPPLSYKITSKKIGPLIITAEIKKGETLTNLLDRLSEENQEAWAGIYDSAIKKMRSPIRTILNGIDLSPSVLVNTKLAENDKIVFMLVYGGG